jgi:hypothetical protein
MITSEVQYRATRAHAARFEEALRNLEAEDAGPHDNRHGLVIAAVRSQLSDIEAELAEHQRRR